MGTVDPTPPALAQGGLLVLAAVAYGAQLVAGLPLWVRAFGLVAAALAFVVGGARDLTLGDRVSAVAWLVSSVALAALAAAAVTAEATFATVGFGLLLVGGAGLFARGVTFG